MEQYLPTRTLREHPDLDQLKRQAKELLAAYLAGDAGARAEVDALYHDADPATFALHHAQLVLARAHGFPSWPKLKAHIDGITEKRLASAVQDGDMEQVRGVLKLRPELAHRGHALHNAVLARSPEMVRVLMEHGANAREGVYPHRDATSALTIAMERGYDEIVAIIKEAERRRRESLSGVAGAPEPDEAFRAIATGNNDHAIALMEANPALIHTRHHMREWTPLHVAAQRMNTEMVAWLLDHGADPMPRGFHDITPMDIAASSSSADSVETFNNVAARLRQSGAAMTARAAVALGDAEWLRARHTAGTLSNPIEDTGGLLRIAASHNRVDVLALLLDFGLDPDERMMFDEGGGDEVAFTWGMPLYHCAGSGKYEMAEMLLKRGADPNGRVYASGDPMFQAYDKQDWKMVELLQRYGGVTQATSAGLFRQTDLARKMLSGEAPFKLDGTGGDTLAEQLLWGSACGGDPEVVRMALEHVDWPRDDIRWFHILEQPLRIWGPEDDRSVYHECFRRVLNRCNPNLRGRVQDEQQFGLTILHSVAGSREHVLPEDRVAFATMLLDAGARLDIRDNLLKSTPLGWACRWGRVELVRLFLERGAPQNEPNAEPWATPLAWAQKMQHEEILALLSSSGRGSVPPSTPPVD